MRALALLALAALAAPAAVMAQETPPTANGPFLFLQQEGDVIVLASMAERRPTAAGASATTVSFLRQDDGSLLRGDSVTEADCTRRMRRTGNIFVQNVADPDVPIIPFTSVPGFDWEAPGPLDGPLMDFLCEDGRHDASQVSPRVSTFVTRWLEGR